MARAKAWLDDHACRRTPMGELEWGEGSDDVSLFSTLTPAEEKAQVDAARARRRLESDAGYGAISWPVEHGGAGCPGPMRTLSVNGRILATSGTARSSSSSPPAHNALMVE